MEALQLRETCILVACVIKELVRKRCIFHEFYSGSEKINESRYSSFPSTFSCSKAYFCFVPCWVAILHPRGGISCTSIHSSSFLSLCLISQLHLDGVCKWMVLGVDFRQCSRVPLSPLSSTNIMKTLLL